MISGIGVPVDLDLESLTLGYVFKSEYFLPVNSSDYFNIIGDPFDPTPRPINSRKRRDESKMDGNYEKYDVEVREIESGPNEENIVDHEKDKYNRKWYEDDEPIKYTLEDIKKKQPNRLEQSRYTLYKGLEKMAEASGLPGRLCLLRSICESAEAPFSFSNGILGELAHILLS